MLLNGPNLNLLGVREPGLYGSVTLSQVEKRCTSLAQNMGYSIFCAQSNAEHVLIDFVHSARELGYLGIVINAGAYAHTSIALHDAFLAVDLPFCSVHITDVDNREDFRKVDYLKSIAGKCISNKGADGYEAAVRWLISEIANK